MREVRRILFEDCKNTSTWDHLGNADPVTSSRKGVTIGETSYFEDDLILLDLPQGLGLLFSIVSGVSGATKYCPNLRQLLETAAAPAPPVDPCHVLYEGSRLRKERVAELVKKRLEELEEHEKGECTFRPKISKAAEERPSKGMMNFISECVAWKKASKERLAKKAAKLAEDSMEDQKQWEMNNRSRKLVEKAEQRRLAEETDTSHSPREKSPTFARKKGEAAPVAFSPVTTHCATKNTVSTFLRSASPDGTVRVAEQQRELVQRLLDDAKAREQRAAERKLYYEALRRETLFDHETGQPLFQPNAQPTLKVGEKRVPFHELSDQQKDELKKLLHTRHCGHVIKISDKKSSTQRTITEIVATIDEKVKQREQQLERIRRNDEREKSGWFKPKIDERSAQTAVAKGRVPLHKKTLPKPTTPAPLPPPPKSSAKEMADLVSRNNEWLQQKQKLIQKKKAEVEKEELAEVTAKPKIHSSSDLVNAAEQRMAAEVQLSRQHRDAASTGSVEARSNSTMSMKSATGFRQQQSSGALRRQRAHVDCHASPRALGNHFSPPPQGPRTAFPSSEAHQGLLPPEITSCSLGNDDGLQELLDSWKQLEQETDRALQTY